MVLTLKVTDQEKDNDFPETYFTANSDAIEWTAPEYPKYIYGRRWYIVITGIMALLLLWAIFSKNYFFLAFIMLAYTLMLYYAKRPSEKISFSLSSTGATVGKNLYEYRNIKSFYIFERPSGPEISLMSKKSRTQPIVIPLGEIPLRHARSFLLNYLPEETQEENSIDEVGRAFGF